MIHDACSILRFEHAYVQMGMTKVKTNLRTLILFALFLASDRESDRKTLRTRNPACFGAAAVNINSEEDTLRENTSTFRVKLSILAKPSDRRQMEHKVSQIAVL